MVQRYKFESKSQHLYIDNHLRCCCFQWFKDTNLKVNHNSEDEINRVRDVVSNGSKIQI